jgi:hypothetical protein
MPRGPRAQGGPYEARIEPTASRQLVQLAHAARFVASSPQASSGAGTAPGHEAASACVSFAAARTSRALVGA